MRAQVGKGRWLLLVTVLPAVLLVALQSGKTRDQRADNGHDESESSNALLSSEAPARGWRRAAPTDIGAADQTAPELIYRQRALEFPAPAEPDTLAQAFEMHRAGVLSGSGASAYMLFVSLIRCETAFQSDEDLEEAFDQATESVAVRLPTGIEVQLQSAEDIEALKSDLKEQRRFCANPSLDERDAQAIQWLRIAADSGYGPAVGRIGWHMQHNDIGTSQERLAYFETALAAGFSDGAWGAYEELRPKEDNQATADLIRSTAYLRVYARLLSQKIDAGFAGPISGMQVDDFRETIASIESRLSIDDRRSVRRQEEAILIVSQANCCVH